MLIGAFGVARHSRKMGFVLRVVVDLEMVRFVDVPLELVVVDLVIPVIRRELRLRIDAGAGA